MTKLAIGDPAPPFALRDQRGDTVRMKDFRGRKLLVYFYPEADTPGCTVQSCDVRDHLEDLASLGVDVVGISPDEPAAQLAFDEKFGLGFPLLCDTDHAVSIAWGTWGEKKLYGKPWIGMTRSSFLIDERGRIERAWYFVRAAQTVPKARAALEASE